MKRGWSNNGRRGRDMREKKGDYHLPHVRSPPTFQTRLRLRLNMAASGSLLLCLVLATVNRALA